MANATGLPTFNVPLPKRMTEDRQDRIDRVKKNHKEVLRLVYRDFFQLCEDGNCDDMALLVHTMSCIVESCRQMIIDSGKCVDCPHLDCPAAGSGKGLDD